MYTFEMRRLSIKMKLGTDWFFFVFICYHPFSCFSITWAPVISLYFLMDFMMHNMIAIISSILLMNSRALNISKPLVPEISLVRLFDFLCISLMMKVQSRSEVPWYGTAISCYRISVPSKGSVLCLEVRGVKQCLCNEFLRAQEALVCTCQSLSKPELQVLFGGRKTKEKICCSWVLRKRHVRGAGIPASPFSWFLLETSAATKHCLDLLRDHNTLEPAPRVKMLAAWGYWSLRTSWKRTA